MTGPPRYGAFWTRPPQAATSSSRTIIVGCRTETHDLASRRIDPALLRLDDEVPRNETDRRGLSTIVAS
jgi:hypothetical protein